MNFARKYRPDSFSEIKGQRLTVEVLKNGIKLGKIGKDITALLFSGQRGVGKTTLARIVAKSLNCVKGQSPEPCNKCDNCIEIKNSRSLDVFEIDGASNRGIEQIRNLRENIRLVPTKSRYKIVIIDEVHMLSQDAFNALLKTLEEPPPNVIFIFATTELYKIPETILSRTLIFDLPPLNKDEIIERLKEVCNKEKINIEDGALSKIAIAGEGSLRDALTLLEKVNMYKYDEKITINDVDSILGFVDEECFFEIFHFIHQKNFLEVFKTLNNLLASGYNEMNIVKGFIEFLNEVLKTKIENKKNKFSKVKDMFEVTDLIRFLKIMFDTENNLRWTSNPKILLEFAFAKLLYIPRSFDIERYLLSAGLVDKDEKYVPYKEESIKNIFHTPFTEPPRESKFIAENPWNKFVQEIKKEKPLLSILFESLSPPEFHEEEIVLAGNKTIFSQVEEDKEFLELKIKEFFHKPYKIKVVVPEEKKKEKSEIQEFLEKELNLEFIDIKKGKR